MQQNLVPFQPYFSYALLDSLDAIVRDRLSSNASSSSKNGIFKEIATFRKVSKVGDISPLNHLDQLLSSTPVAVFKSLYERFKNFSLFLDSQAYIVFITILSCVSLSTNSCVTILTNIAQTAKRLLQQALTAINHLPVRSGYFKRKHYEYNKNVGAVCTPSSCIVRRCVQGILDFKSRIAATPFKRKGGVVVKPPLPQRKYPEYVGFNEAKRQGYLSTTELRRQVLYQYKGRCFICGIEEWRYLAALQMHRVIPGKSGGLYKLDNVIPLCRKCHRPAEGKTWDELNLIQSLETKWAEVGEVQ